LVQLAKLAASNTIRVMLKKLAAVDRVAGMERHGMVGNQSPGRERISRRSLAAMGATVLGPRFAAHTPMGWSALAAPPSADSLFAPTLKAGPDQGSLWVQPPNHGGAGRLAPDFFEMFTTRTDEWAEARRFVDVWVVRMTSLLGKDAPLSDDFLQESFLPKLHAWGIALAVNVTAATLAQCANHPGPPVAGEVAVIQRLLDLGAHISSLSLQSPLSKVGGRVCPAYGKETGYDLRIADVVRYVAAMTERFPGIEIGLVDAMPAKGWGYQDVYRHLQDALTARGLRLAFIHLDFPLESAAPGWVDVREAEDFVRGELGVPFGLIYVSKIGGETSNVAFRDAVLDAYRAYRAAGGRPDHLKLTSWYAYPTSTLPEDDEASAPFMNLVRDFALLGGVVPQVAPGTPPVASPVAVVGSSAARD
jgi:hypothetical protein